MKFPLPLIWCICILFAGCATTRPLPDDNKYAPDYAGLDTSKKIFLLPVRTDIRQVLNDTEKVQQYIVEHLQLNGWAVETMDADEFDRQWQTAVNQVGGLYSPQTGQLMQSRYEQAYGYVLTNLKSRQSYAAILKLDLVIREATLDGRYAFWDGVRLRKIVRGSYGPDLSWSGNTPGLSLVINAFSSDLEWLFTSYGGLALPYATQMRADNPVDEFREDALGIERDVRAGVGIALSPVKPFANTP